MSTRLLAALSIASVLSFAAVARADDCCRYVIEGCGKKQNVCVPGDCNSSNRARAKAAFEQENKCSSSSDASYIRTCSNEKCDLDLRKK
jgi:hypothetical protein